MENLLFIWPNQDLQKEYPENQYEKNSSWIVLSKLTDIIVSWGINIWEDFIISNRGRIEVILSRWVWIDNFDLDAFNKNWILYWNNPEVSQDWVFHHWLSFLFHSLLEKEKISNINLIDILKNEKILIIWEGTIWNGLVSFLSSISKNITSYSSYKDKNLEDKINKNSTIILTSKLTNLSKGLINSQLLELLKWKTLINISRKELIEDESFLNEYIQTKDLKYYTDVYRGEEEKTPLFLNSHKNLYYTNHEAWRAINNLHLVYTQIKAKINLIIVSGESQIITERKRFILPSILNYTEEELKEFMNFLINIKLEKKEVISQNNFYMISKENPLLKNFKLLRHQLFKQS